MSAPKHTPGPWRRNIRAGGKYPTVFAGRNTHVAIVQQQPSGEETEANIDLIAAAPRMEAALRKIEKWITDANIKSQRTVLTDWCRDEARAAIAASEGSP